MVSLKELEISKLLYKLRKRTDITCSLLFDEEGFIVAVDQINFSEGSECHQIIGAICSGIIAMAENGIIAFNEECFVKNISIKAGIKSENEGFIINLDLVWRDIVLAVIIPRHLNLGIVRYEINKSLEELKAYFSIYTLDEISGEVKTLY